MNNISQYKELLEKMKTLYIPPEPEKTIFSIGSRGYYENPTTDILAFFCSSDETHGMGTLVVDALMELFPQEIQEVTNRNTQTLREVFTEQGKRIDLVIEGQNWVIILENKIFHHQSNPFKDYEDWAKKHYKDKKIIFAILCPSGKSSQKDWYGISYPDFVNSIKAKLGDFFISAPLNKWSVLLREFILHLEGFMSKSTLPDATTDFILNNFSKIEKLEKLKRDFIGEYGNKIVAKLNEELGGEISYLKESWGIRFFWHNKPIWTNNNAALHFNRSEENTTFFRTFAWISNKAQEVTPDDWIRQSSINNATTTEYHKINKITKEVRCFSYKLVNPSFEEIVVFLKERLVELNSFENKTKVLEDLDWNNTYAKLTEKGYSIEKSNIHSQETTFIIHLPFNNGKQSRLTLVFGSWENQRWYGIQNTGTSKIIADENKNPIDEKLNNTIKAELRSFAKERKRPFDVDSEWWFSFWCTSHSTACDEFIEFIEKTKSLLPN